MVTCYNFNFFTEIVLAPRLVQNALVFVLFLNFTNCIVHLTCYVCFSAAWIGAMAMGLNFFFGPISSALCDRFGCQLVSLAGALLSVMGLFLTSFIQEVYKMYVTYGLVWGVGSSFSFVSSIVVLGQYFNSRLALANGIATSGSGFGSLVAGPVINYLLQSLGWKNSMRILSAFALVLWFAACFFKPRMYQGHSLRNSKLFDTSIWKNKAYILWVTTVALFQFGYLIPFVHLVSGINKFLNIVQPRSQGLLLFPPYEASSFKL